MPDNDSLIADPLLFHIGDVTIQIGKDANGVACVNVLTDTVDGDEVDQKFRLLVDGYPVWENPTTFPRAAEAIELARHTFQDPTGWICIDPHRIYAYPTEPGEVIVGATVTVFLEDEEEFFPGVEKEFFLEDEEELLYNEE